MVSFLPGRFDEHGGIVDVGIGDGHAQPDIAATAPASRPDENKLAFRQQLVQLSDGATNVAHRILIGKLTVGLEVNIDNMSDLGYLSVGDKVPGRKNNLVGRQVLWD